MTLGPAVVSSAVFGAAGQCTCTSGLVRSLAFFWRFPKQMLIWGCGTHQLLLAFSPVSSYHQLTVFGGVPHPMHFCIAGTVVSNITAPSFCLSVCSDQRTKAPTLNNEDAIATAFLWANNMGCKGARPPSSIDIFINKAIDILHHV